MKKNYKNILVPIDGSEPSTEALLEAIEIVKRNDGKLTILNVIDTSQINANFYSYNAEVATMLRESSESFVNSAEKSIPKDISTESVIKSGKPKREIIEYAKSTNADLIIIGATGTGKFERLMLGSTTAYVVNNAHCNVMVVR